MTLPVSGAISMSQVANELNLSSTDINLNHAWVRALAQVASGAISMSNLQGKTGRFDGNVNVTAPGGFYIGSFSNAPFFGSTLLNMQGGYGAGGSINLYFNSAPNWTGNIKVTNNTTGVSVILPYQFGSQWGYASAPPANFFRVANDNFTITPSN